MQGVKLKIFNDLIRDHLEIITSKRTTADVCAIFVKPETVCCSYVELLKRQERMNYVGVAEAFISHSWSCPFFELVVSLNNHFKDPNKMIWIDVFSDNLHEVIDLETRLIKLKATIAQIGHTVMVLNQWRRPLALSEAQRTFEMYCTHATNCKFELALGNEFYDFEHLDYNPSPVIKIIAY